MKPHRLLDGSKHHCSKECALISARDRMVGENNHQYGLKGFLNASFKTGERISTYGYKLIYKPNHSRRQYNGYVFEHLLIMEKHLGRPLKFIDFNNKDNEVCHHIDRNRLNNDINNLKLMTLGST